MKSKNFIKCFIIYLIFLQIIFLFPVNAILNYDILDNEIETSFKFDFNEGHIFGYRSKYDINIYENYDGVDINEYDRSFNRYERYTILNSTLLTNHTYNLTSIFEVYQNITFSEIIPDFTIDTLFGGNFDNVFSIMNKTNNGILKNSLDLQMNLFLPNDIFLNNFTTNYTLFADLIQLILASRIIDKEEEYLIKINATPGSTYTNNIYNVTGSINDSFFIINEYQKINASKPFYFGEPAFTLDFEKNRSILIELNNDHVINNLDLDITYYLKKIGGISHTINSYDKTSFELVYNKSVFKISTGLIVLIIIIIVLISIGVYLLILKRRCNEDSNDNFMCNIGKNRKKEKEQLLSEFKEKKNN